MSPTIIFLLCVVTLPALYFLGIIARRDFSRWQQRRQSERARWLTDDRPEDHTARPKHTGLKPL